MTRAYVASDAEPAADTFIGHAVPPPADAVADAIARAHAARAALRELDGRLPEQPLAVTVHRTAAGAVSVPSALDVAAFAIGDRVVRARLAVSVDDEAPLAAALARALRGEPAALAPPTATPFVTVALGDEPIATARHGHRRAWLSNGATTGPWLGLSRTDGLALVSTCHLIVDGYGHAWLAARIAEHARKLAPRAPQVAHAPPPPLVAITGATALDVAWRPLAEAPRALPLAYALGRLLHRSVGRPSARSSPAFQIPVAPGAPDDPDRRRRRVVPAVATVRFARGAPEPFDAFAARARGRLARAAAGSGMVNRLLAAARAAPAPLAWKRRAVAASRPRWLAPVAELLGGRGCVSRIFVEEAVPPSCAVSAPNQHDGWVVTAIEDGSQAAVTLCGNGVTDDLLSELLALVP